MLGSMRRGLVASLAALALALAALAGAQAAAAAGLLSEPEPLAGGSAVGILLDGSPEANPDAANPQGGDSQLKLLLASAGAVPEARFNSQGEVFVRKDVPFGTAIVAPDTRPEWSWSADAAHLYGFSREAGDTPAFAGWYEREAGDGAPGLGTGEAYDGSRVAVDAQAGHDFYAGWEDGSADDVRLVTVALDLAGGTMAAGTTDPVTGKAVGGPSPLIERRAGEPWKWLPQPSKAGYRFLGWAPQGSGAVIADVAAEALPAEATAESGYALTAQWAPAVYTVVFIDRSDGKGDSWEQQVTYGAGDRLMTWEALLAASAAGGGRLSAPAGKEFAGWATVRNYDPAHAPAGARYLADGAALAPDLADADGARAVLYAQWRDRPLEDSYEVVLHYKNGSAGEDAPVTVTVKAGDPVTAGDGYVEPKRTGYQFAGWWYADGAAPGEEPAEADLVKWDLARPVISAHRELWAKWTLRLDVTLPVEVGFAVDADSRKVTTPEADVYAIKSRTVAPVQVEEMAVVSQDGELEEFFDLGEGAEGWQSALQGTALWVWKTGPGGASAWTTDFSQEPDGADDLSFKLPLANAAGERGEYTRVKPDGTPGERIEGWRNAVSLAGNDKFRLEAFSYAGTSFDEGWQGGDPSVTLPLKLGMGISGDLEVETALDGPKPLTHLIVTVSAKG